MALTFPIDTKEPAEIAAFSSIFSEYSNSVANLSGMLKYLCYRFDPKCSEVRKMIGVTEKDRLAGDMAKWYPPEPLVLIDPGTRDQTLNGEYISYCDVQGEFFRLLDNDEWEFIVSLDIAIHNANMVIREPLPTGMDPEKKGKAILNIQKAIEGNKLALETRKSAAMGMADNDTGSAKAILSSTKSSRASMSPEGHLRNA